MNELDLVLVTIYCSLVAVMLCSGLYVLSALSINDQGNLGKYFRRILIHIIVVALSDVVAYSAKHHMFGAPDRALAFTAETVMELAVTMLVWNWLAFVDYYLNHSMDHINFRNKWRIIPLYLVLALLAINIATGWVFVYDENVVYSETPLYYVQVAIKYLYVFISFYIIARYRRENGVLHFLNPWNFALPCILGTAATMFSKYSFMGLGFALAMMMVYLEIINERCYIDAATGFHNLAYLDHIYKTIEEGKYTFKSAIIFEIEDPAKAGALAKVLKSELPEGCETIRVEEGKYLSLTQADRTSSLNLAAEEVEFGVEDWNEEHPDEHIEMEYTYLLRKNEEDEKDFINRLIGGEVS